MTKIFNKKSQTQKRKLLRKNLPKTEIALWVKLKNKKINGFKFRRQYSINRYVVDFYCPMLKLAIEIDGNYHNTAETKNYDKLRQNFIENYGIKFLRFSNSDITENLEGVIKTISQYCKKPLPTLPL